MYVRKADERGRANFGWLDSKHTFSFGSYYDPNHMGFSKLRVINDDRVAPGAGFDTHGHRDMEIITYVIDGALEHKDSMGNNGVITAGEVQRMSAGTGVMHSEFNHSSDDEVHFLQIWIEPGAQNLEPGYEQKFVTQEGKVTPLVTPDGEGDSLRINQQASIHRVKLVAGEEVTLGGSRKGYLHVVDGEGRAAEVAVSTGDGVGVEPGLDLTVSANDDFEALWFELP